MILVIPSDPLDPRRADEHFRDEALAARSLGADVVLVDHDALTRGDLDEVLRRRPGGPAQGDAFYRGWMVTPEEYAQLEAVLARAGVVLLTSAVHYRDAHELPGWYLTLEPVTPESVWTTGADLAELTDLATKNGFGRSILRDYSKSLKHHWDEACLVPDASDSIGLRRVAQRFCELRDPISGGLVLRRFEDFTGAEARTWWRDGRHVLTTAHPDTPEQLPVPDLSAFAPLLAELALPLVTLDLVLRTDGVWRAVELGDGGVSDRPRSAPSVDANGFLAAVLDL